MLRCVFNDIFTLNNIIYTIYLWTIEHRSPGVKFYILHQQHSADFRHRVQSVLLHIVLRGWTRLNGRLVSVLMVVDDDDVGVVVSMAFDDGHVYMKDANHNCT